MSAPSPPISHCLNCGYALQGLGASDVCPECGHSIPTASDVDAIGALPIDVMRCVRRGVQWYGRGVLSFIAIGLALLAASVVAPTFTAMSVAIVGPALSLLAMQIGWWMIGTPSARDAEPQWPGVWSLRIATILMVALTTVWAALDGLGWPPLVSGVSDQTMLLLVITIGLVAVIRFGIVAHTVARLARAMHDPTLEQRGRSVGRQLIVVLGLLIPGAFMVSRHHGAPAVAALGSYVLIFAVIAGVIVVGSVWFSLVRLLQLIERRLDRLRSGSMSRLPRVGPP